MNVNKTELYIKFESKSYYQNKGHYFDEDGDVWESIRAEEIFMCSDKSFDELEDYGYVDNEYFSSYAPIYTLYENEKIYVYKNPVENRYYLLADWMGDIITKETHPEVFV